MSETVANHLEDAAGRTRITLFCGIDGFSGEREETRENDTDDSREAAPSPRAVAFHK
ncbi:MAG: hypothetical protein IPL45_04295 [Actinomycetales bacterium]|nr:hypothetical protein [Actinomycetales bacterium]